MKRRFFGYAAGAALFLLFLFSSADARQGAADGLRLWGTLLVPSLLPYFAAAGLLTRLGAVDALARRLAPAAARLFGVSGAGAAVFLLGLSGGYPLGAASIGALYRDGWLRKDEAEHLLAFCDNSGLAFAVGALGGAVTAAGQTILQIGAYVIFFSALIASLGALGFPDTLAGELALCTGGPLSFFRALFTGTLELSSGVGAMAGLPLTPGSLALGEFLLSWGGLCVHGQAGAAAEGLKMRKRLGGKLLQGVFSAALAYAAASIIM